MSLDYNKIAFSSEHAIDKVVHTDTISVVNDGATSHPQAARIVASTAVNPYGKKCFVRARWSIDGVNFNSLSSHLVYTFSLTVPGPSTTTVSGLKAGCSIGVSDSTIHFRTANGFHGNASFNGVSYTYTPTSLTFTIEYALYEIQ